MLSRCLAAYLYHNNIYAEWEAKCFCSTRLIFGSDDITMSIEILGVRTRSDHSSYGARLSAIQNREVYHQMHI